MKKENEEISKHTVLRLFNGFLEFREEYGKKAKDNLKALKVVVTGEDDDFQIISLKELQEYKDEDLIPMKSSSPFKPDYKLYRFVWKPFQEIGVVLRIIEKKKNGNKRGKQNRSKL